MPRHACVHEENRRCETKCCDETACSNISHEASSVVKKARCNITTSQHQGQTHLTMRETMSRGRGGRSTSGGRRTGRGGRGRSGCRSRNDNDVNQRGNQRNKLSDHTCNVGLAKQASDFIVVNECLIDHVRKNCEHGGDTTGIADEHSTDMDEKCIHEASEHFVVSHCLKSSRHELTMWAHLWPHLAAHLLA